MKIRHRRVRKTDGGWYSYWQADLGQVGGARVRKNYRTKSAAEAALASAKSEKERLGVGALALTHEERVEMLSAKDRLAPFKATITDAVDFFVKYHREIPDKTLRVAIDEFIADKRKANKRPRYIRQLGVVLNRFANGREDGLVKEVHRDDLEAWVNGNGWEAKTRANYITDLKTFFAWCDRKKWLVENPAEHIQKPTVERGRPAILTAEQAANLMAKAQASDPGICGYLALCLFAGIRPEEVERLPKSAIDLKAGVIRIPREVSKTRRERDVVIESNLRAWLRRDVELPVVNLRNRFRKVREAAGLFDIWTHDVLRHSYGTYHVCKYEAVGRTALQMGNSEAIVKAHYLDHVRDKNSVAKFWAIRPEANR